MSHTCLAPEFSGEFFVPGKSRQRMEADHMERYLFACKFAHNKSVLDIACGTGYSAPLFTKAGAARYHGVDINKKLITYANETYGSYSVNFFVGDICKYDNGKPYSLITCFETIEHVDKYETALTNLFNLLENDGILIISSPNRPVTSPDTASLQDKPKNQFHTQEFTPRALLSLLHKSGFSATKDDVYGQRQRKLHSNRIVRKSSRIMFGNPDKTTSPMLTLVKDKVPRYFTIVAMKK